MANLNTVSVENEVLEVFGSHPAIKEFPFLTQFLQKQLLRYARARSGAALHTITKNSPDYALKGLLNLDPLQDTFMSTELNKNINLILSYIAAEINRREKEWPEIMKRNEAQMTNAIKKNPAKAEQIKRGMTKKMEKEKGLHCPDNFVDFVKNESAGKLLRLARKWKQDYIDRKISIEYAGGDSLVYDFGDGYQMVELVTDESMVIESDGPVVEVRGKELIRDQKRGMNHCIGRGDNYMKKRREGTHRYFSLRYQGKRERTIEVLTCKTPDSADRLLQNQGRSNKNEGNSIEHVEKVFEFCEKTNYGDLVEKVNLYESNKEYSNEAIVRDKAELAALNDILTKLDTPYRMATSAKDVTKDTLIMDCQYIDLTSKEYIEITYKVRGKEVVKKGGEIAFGQTNSEHIHPIIQADKITLMGTKGSIIERGCVFKKLAWINGVSSSGKLKINIPEEVETIRLTGFDGVELALCSDKKSFIREVDISNSGITNVTVEGGIVIADFFNNDLANTPEVECGHTHKRSKVIEF